MLRRTTTRRTGFSLIEVFVAMFIMAIGMIALLTLFPVGAVQMGHALRDDRSQTTALQADATLRMWWQREVVEAFANYGVQNAEDVPFWVMDDPNDPWIGGAPGPVTHPAVTTLPGAPNYTFAVRPATNTVLPRPFPLAIPSSGLNSEKPSFPVLIDPIGFNSYSGNLNRQFWVAGLGSDAPAPPTQFSIPRRTMRSVGTSLPQIARACSLLDDIEFSRTADSGYAPGYPDLNAGSAVGTVVRQGRYNWGAVIQRQNNSFRNIADLKILVYDRRAPGIAPTDAELHYAATATVGATQIVLNDPLDLLKLRYNGWIMDGTTDPTTGIRNANFYRVQSVTENFPAVGQKTIELQTPIKPATGSPGLATYTAQIYVLSNLIDVFDRPQLIPSNYIQQVP